MMWTIQLNKKNTTTELQNPLSTPHLSSPDPKMSEL